MLGIPAIGERTAASLVVRMPELGQVSRSRQPRSRVWRRSCTRAANIRARRISAPDASGRALYMPAMVGATRYNPILKALNDRLKRRGKPSKRALIACARNLLIIANAVVARGTPWEDRSTTPA